MSKRHDQNASSSSPNMSKHEDQNASSSSRNMSERQDQNASSSSRSMSEPQNQNASSSSNEVDYMGLCEDIVRRMQEVVKRAGKLLNERRCRDLVYILSVKLLSIRMAVDACDPIMKPVVVTFLAPLHRYYEKAKVLVKQCAQEDWCAAAVFQDGNAVLFETILLQVNFWGLHILPIVERHSTFKAVGFFSSVDEVGRDVGADKEDLRMRLEGVKKGLGTEQAPLKRQQHLARYLLKKHKLRSEHMTPNTPFTLDALKPILWEKDSERASTWGDSTLLGSGSGASGVCKTSWLGVPCAKEFHEEAFLKIFVKEALIMAQLKHPCIVDFICCGNGEAKGDRYIAMELMEKNLSELIEKQKGVPFPTDVVVDIILQIADGVRYLHNNGVAHRDLKPQNVVVKAMRSPYHEKTYYCVKLVDFGISKNEVEASKSNTMSFRGIVTTMYRAPEAHPSAHPEGLGKVDWFKADAYSFAMTCAHILTLKIPFEDMKPLSKLYMELLDGKRPLLPMECPKELVELLEECWSTARSKRPKFRTIYGRLQNLMQQYFLFIPEVYKLL